MLALAEGRITPLRSNTGQGGAVAINHAMNRECMGTEIEAEMGTMGVRDRMIEIK